MTEAILETPHMPGRPEGVVEGHLDAAGQLGLAPARVLHRAYDDVLGLGTGLLVTHYTLFITHYSSHITHYTLLITHGEGQLGLAPARVLHCCAHNDVAPKLASCLQNIPLTGDHLRDNI